MVKEWCYTLKGRFRPLTCCNFCLNDSSKSENLWKPGLPTAHKNMLIAPTLPASSSPPFSQSQKLTVEGTYHWYKKQENAAWTGAFGQWRHTMFHIFKGFLVDLPKRTNIEAGFRGWSSKLVSNQCQPIIELSQSIISSSTFHTFSYLLTFNQLTNPSCHSLSSASLPWCPVHHGSNPIGPWDSAHPNSSASPSFCRTRSRKITGNTSWYAAGCLSQHR